MQVPNWDVFPAEFQAALIQTYPGIAWRAVLDPGEGPAHDPTGIVIWARRRGVDVEVRVPAVVIADAYLPELLQGIYEEAETRLSGGMRP